MKTYAPSDEVFEPIKAVQLTPNVINSYPRTGAAIVRAGDGIALYTGRFVGRNAESVQGSQGDYIVEFKNGEKTIIQKILFEKLYKEAPEVVESETEETPIKEEENGTESSSGIVELGTDGGSDAGKSSVAGTAGAPSVEPSSGKDDGVSPEVVRPSAGRHDGESKKNSNHGKQS